MAKMTDEEYAEYLAQIKAGKLVQIGGRRARNAAALDFIRTADTPDPAKFRPEETGKFYTEDEMQTLALQNDRLSTMVRTQQATNLDQVKALEDKQAQIDALVVNAQDKNRQISELTTRAQLAESERDDLKARVAELEALQPAQPASSLKVVDTAPAAAQAVPASTPVPGPAPAAAVPVPPDATAAPNTPPDATIATAAATKPGK